MGKEGEASLHDIGPDDIIIESYHPEHLRGRSSGPPKGISIYHKPTGIKTACHTLRSEHQNRMCAMDILRGRLAEHYKPKKLRKLPTGTRFKAHIRSSDIYVLVDPDDDYGVITRWDGDKCHPLENAAPTPKAYRKLKVIVVE